MENIIDYQELNSQKNKGEKLELLTRSLLVKSGFEPIFHGRGADGGRDLTFTERLNSAFQDYDRKWLVQCKHKAESGNAVSDSDLGSASLIDKLKQYGAEGYLLITTTVLGSSVSKMFEDFNDIKNAHVFHCWDYSKLNEKLLIPQNRDVLKEYFPKSYKEVSTLNVFDSIDVFLKNTDLTTTSREMIKWILRRDTSIYDVLG